MYHKPSHTCAHMSPYIIIGQLLNFVLGSEKIRFMEGKMNNIIEILGPSLFSLQNELCLMKIDQSSQKIQLFEVESQHSTSCDLRFSNCSIEK